MTMTRENLQHCIELAQNFIEKAEARIIEIDDIEYYSIGTKRSGAVRRASLDLTRALAGRLGLEPSQIVLGNGSDDILTIITRAYVPQGGLVVSPTPSYLPTCAAQVAPADHTT
mgnify:CR=1 FL=1